MAGWRKEKEQINVVFEETHEKREGDQIMKPGREKQSEMKSLNVSYVDKKIKPIFKA